MRGAFPELLLLSMPSANKGGSSPVETTDTIQNIMSVVEKKARNLDKKRIHQLELKQKKDGGAQLDKDQRVFPWAGGWGYSLLMLMFSVVGRCG
jgi:hypothetical protein